ncbi:MAG TPA: carboxypeptidase regulatory-like domain-containing protein [Bryobacteraceae bacterium]|nr:carboxypeptidase regulatory-like domain-containing protein [Bryobacteraceae bacterium]
MGFLALAENSSRSLRCLLTFLLLAAGLFAQTDRATLRGIVSDPSGAIVPGADVVVTEVATNSQRKFTSDENGNYEIPGLKPGLYRLAADKAGFRAFVADNLLLDAGQVRRMDVTLQVGATTETVTVQAGAALIQTETGTISGELDKKKFLDRPLVDVYPSPLALMTTMPGIQGNGWNLVMSGISDRQKQSWQMDGVANDTAGDQNDNPAFFETVQVTSVSSGADASRATSFNMVSKRGSNDWHASASYKHENSGLNAREFFDMRPKKSPYILHETNFDVTGPIIKDRTFFYVAWFHQTIPLGSWVNRNTPTLKMRQGDFSEYPTAVRDPLNNDLPFPDKKIPLERFNSVSKKAMDLYYPLPNQGAANSPTNNYGWYFPYNSDLYKGDWPMFRVDHKFTESNNLFVRWMARKTPYIRPGSGFEWATYTQKRDHRQMVISDTHVFSPTLVNTFTFGRQTDFFLYGEDEKGVKPLTGAEAVAALGIQGVNAKGYKAMGFPQISINGLATLNNSNGAIDNVNADDGVNTYSDTMTWAKGKHVVKFGGEYRTYWWFSGSIANTVYGNYGFDGSISGVGFADFMLGIPNSTSRLDPLVNRPNHNKQAGFFFTDTFKVTPKLTLDYGLRWDYYANASYDDGLMYNFDLKTGSVIVPAELQSKIHPLYPKNIPIITGDVVPPGSRKNIRPRISAAYRLTNKTVIRGGYGEFTDSWSYTARRPGSDPFVLTESYNNAKNALGLSFPNPFPANLGAATVASQSVTAWPMDTENGTIRQFNFTLEQEIYNMGIRLSYIGMRNSGLNYGTYNMNKPQPSTTPFAQSRRPYPLFNSVNVFGTDGKVHYNSAQFEVQRRIGSLVFNSNFTWSKNMYNWANTENPYAITDKWARDANNRERYWVSSLTWQLPFGKDRRFLNQIPGALNQVIGGWTTNFISTFASPTYASPSYNNTPLAGGGTTADPSGTSTNGGLPDAIGDPQGSGFNRTVNQWFDKNAYAPPPVGRFGNASPNSIEGYPIRVQHLSVAKAFPVTERLKMTFTGSFSNLLNHPHFGSTAADGFQRNIQNADTGKFTATRPNYEPEKQSYRQIDLKLRIEF